MSDNPNVIRPSETRLMGIYFSRKTTPLDPQNPSVDIVSTETTFAVSNVTIIAILGTIAGLLGSLEYLGSFLTGLVTDSSDTASPKVDDRTIFAIAFKNGGCGSLDLTTAFKELQAKKWRNGTVELAANCKFFRTLTKDEAGVLSDFRYKLPQLDLLTQRTLLVLDEMYGTPGGVSHKILH